MGSAGDTVSKNRVKQVAGAVLVLFIALLAWQLVAAHQARQERDEVELELTLQRMATDLAMAAIEANYGSYEGARELTSSFFTRLQQNAGRLPPEGRETANAILVRRDEVITSLSRRDPESPEILTRMFFRYPTVVRSGSPSALAIRPTASWAVRLLTSSTGFNSTISRLTSRFERAVFSQMRWASR